MKSAEVARRLDRFAKDYPQVADVIVNMASDLHTLKVQHNTFMMQFAQLAEVVKVLMQQSEMYHGAITQLVDKVKVEVKKNEEFSSEAVDEASERYKQ